MKQKASKVLALVMSYIREPLPQSGEALEQFVTATLAIGGLPDNDSFRHAILTQIMHLDSDTVSVTKQGFIRSLRRSIVNQLAYGQLMLIKERDKNAKAVENSAGQVVQEASE